MNYCELYKDIKKYVGFSDIDVKEYIETNNIDEQDGMHIWFGLVIVPLTKKILKQDDEEKAKLIFDFFEMMACSENIQITEVLEYTVLENIIPYEEIYASSKRFMGEETLKSCESIEKYVFGKK